MHTTKETVHFSDSYFQRSRGRAEFFFIENMFVENNADVVVRQK